MSHIQIAPGALNGEVSMPPSKSAVHRAILCAAMAQGVSTVAPVALSKDIEATIQCVQALGADICLCKQTLTIDGAGLFSKQDVLLDCEESGSTLRFLIPIAAAGGVLAHFTGKGRLPQRPIGVYLDCLPQKGVSLKTQGGLPLTISGQLKSGVYRLPGDISSQFITGLLLSLPLLDGDSEIVLTSALESEGYIDMTLQTMRAFGVTAEKTAAGYMVKGRQRYLPNTNYVCEGDWSQAAFFMAAGALGGNIKITGLNPHSVQGDRACLHLFEQFGANVRQAGNAVTVTRGTLHAIAIDARQIPDLVPILAVVAAFAKGKTTIYGAQRLRIKESDRLKAICSGLQALGADITETDDGLVVQGVSSLHGGTVQGYNDHRIVMALSIAALNASGPVVITDRESIRKSYPSFFEEYKRLGGNAENL